MSDINAYNNPIITRILRDYNQFPNKVLTSVRGGLKTFNVQKLLLDKYFKKGRFFGTLRETKTELESMLRGGFWDNNLISQPPYNKHKYTTIGSKIYIDGELVGVGVALKTYGNFRVSGINVGTKLSNKDKDELEETEELIRNNIQNLRTIFFDEFEPINPQMKGSERKAAFRHIADTFFRLRPNVESIFCGNMKRGSSAMLEELNFPEEPLKYGIRKSYTRTSKQPLAVWAHLEQNAAWNELRHKSYVGKLTEGQNDPMFSTGEATDFVDYNKTPVDPMRRFILYNIHVGGYKFTYWKTRAGIYHITERTKNTTFANYTFNLKECRDGVRLIPKGYLENLLNFWESGKILFDKSSTYENFISILPNKKRS